MSKVIRIGQWTKISLFVFAILFASFLVIKPELSLASASNGAQLWWNVVLPSLLPFFICFELINKSGFVRVIGCFFDPIMKPLFNLPGTCGFAFLEGVTGGYPMGARLSSILRESGQITKPEAEHLLAFTNNSGPLFILGAVASGIFHNYSVGVLLLLTHILSSIIVGIIFRGYKKSERLTSRSCNEDGLWNNVKKELKFFRNEDFNIGQIFVDSVKNSVTLILVIGGFIIFFSVVINMVSHLSLANIENVLARSVFYGFFEITNGINNLQPAIRSDLLGCICFAAFILGFGGFCVHMQVLGIVIPHNISIKLYLLGKTLQGIISFTMTWVFLKTCPDFIIKAKSVFNPLDPVQINKLEQYSLTFIWLPVVLTIVLFVLMILLRIRKRV